MDTKGNLDQVPFTILTGFLGAGKTTTLNRILSAPCGKKIAVLVNELGRIAIDSKLILSQGGDILELAGGCICCKVDIKNDLWDGIAEIIERRKPDHIILETTGIAEPEAIWQGLTYVPEAQRKKILKSGIVCTVDTEAFLTTLDKRDEALEQVKCADRFLLTKLDLASSDVAEKVHAKLKELNPKAERASFLADESGNHGLSKWVTDASLRAKSDEPVENDSSHHHHHRQGQMVAFAIRDEGEWLAEPLLSCIEKHKDALYRVKGFIRLANDPRKGYLELAGLRAEIRYDGVWGQEKPLTEVVFIGENLDQAAITRQLMACKIGE